MCLKSWTLCCLCLSQCSIAGWFYYFSSSLLRSLLLYWISHSWCLLLLHKLLTHVLNWFPHIIHSFYYVLIWETLIFFMWILKLSVQNFNPFFISAFRTWEILTSEALDCLGLSQSGISMLQFVQPLVWISFPVWFGDRPKWAAYSSGLESP